MGAASHRFTYKMTQGWSVLTSTALTIRSQGTLSKNFRMSRSITQSYSQQRSRYLPAASSATGPAGTQGSHLEFGFRDFLQPGRDHRLRDYSATVGTPSILVPGHAVWYFHAITGGGKWLPEDIRFQIL